MARVNDYCSYTMLRDGSWGVRSTRRVKAGDAVTVTKRDGSTKTETVKAVVWSGNGVWLCSTASAGSAPARKAGPSCPVCGRGGRLVEDLEDGLLKHWTCCDMPPE